MKELLRKHRYFLAVLVVDLLILAWWPSQGQKVFFNTYLNFKEMLGIIPPVFVLLGLLDVWVPRETIIKFLGEKSGPVGISLSIFLGAAAAGPLYAAFPIAAVMLKKGSSFTNVMIFLGAWSTLKIPMFLFEMSALGPAFAVTRWLSNVPIIILIAHIINRVVSGEEKQDIYAKHLPEKIAVN